MAHHSLQQLLLVRHCMQRCSHGFVVRYALGPWLEKPVQHHMRRSVASCIMSLAIRAQTQRAASGIPAWNGTSIAVRRGGSMRGLYSSAYLVYPCMTGLHHQAVITSYALQVHADRDGGALPVQGTIAERMAALSARLSDRRLDSHTLPDYSAACETGITYCVTDNTLLYDSPQADKVMAHSLTAASLQQSSSSHWHLSRFLSMGSAQARTEASHEISKQLTPSRCSQGQQQSTSENQTLSSQQENQSTGSPRPHPQLAEARHTSSPWRHSRGILGDVSNVIPSREQGAKTFLKQAPPAVLQAAPDEAESSQLGEADTSACPLEEIGASATQAGDCRADNADQQHGLEQVDDLLREWYHRYAVHSTTSFSCMVACKHSSSLPCRRLQGLFCWGWLTCIGTHRTMQGICSASCLPAAAPEPESVRQPQSTGSHRLHSVLVAAQTGEFTSCLSTLGLDGDKHSKEEPCREWRHTVPHAAGTAVQQMWGVQWRAFAEEAAGSGSTNALANADLAPAQALLESCILAPLLERVCLGHTRVCPGTLS